MSVSLAEQIKCVEREIALRRSTYPGWVEKRRMTQATADREIAAMEAVLHTLDDLRALKLNQVELFQEP